MLYVKGKERNIFTHSLNILWQKQNKKCRSKTAKPHITIFIATELEKIDYIALLKCYNSGVRFGGFMLKIWIQKENIEKQKRKKLTEKEQLSPKGIPDIVHS